MSCENAINSRPESPSSCQHAFKERDVNHIQEPKHFDWLKKRFTDCFGLPTEMYKRRRLVSFDGVELAKGYARVVATWQGLFFELKDEDINYRDLKPGFDTRSGMTTLSTKGVKLFKLTREDTRTTPRPHRFAVKPRGNSTTPCNRLKVGRYYAHVYQTKLEMNGFLKTLNSKSIARDLKKIWGLHYLPRSGDLDQSHQLYQNLPEDPRHQNIHRQQESQPKAQSLVSNLRRSNLKPTRPIHSNRQNNPQQTYAQQPQPTVVPTTGFYPSFPLASNPPPFIYSNPALTHNHQKPRIPCFQPYQLYHMQNPQSLPHQTPQIQPQVNYQPTQLNHHSTPSQYYMSTQHPYANYPPIQNYGLPQQSTNARQQNNAN